MKICFKCLTHIKDLFPVHGLHKECFTSWFKIDSKQLIDFTDVTLKREKSDSEGLSHSFKSSFFQGKFKKYSVRLAERSYILKIQDKNYPELPCTEYISNQIARKLGLIVPDFYFIDFLNEAPAFLTRNFMENYIPGNLIYIYHFVKPNESFSCRTLLNIIEDKIGRIEAIKQLIFLCLFDALIGNHDRHGRNIAFIETKKEFKLAPFYDNPSYIGIEDQSLLRAELNPRGKITTSLTNEPTMQDYVLEFLEMGYEEWVKEFGKKIEQSQIHHMIHTSFLSDTRKTAFSLLIERRFKEFENVITS